MCTKCPNRLFYDPEKKLVYYIDASCNKVPLPAGTIVGGGATGLPDGTSVDDWIDAGSPPIAEPPAAPHTNPLYQTMDSLKCAKATALVNEIWNILTISESLRTTTNLTAAVAGMKELLGAFGWVASAPVTFWLAVANVFTGTVFSEVADELDEVHGNDEAKNELICDLVDRMKTPTKIGSWTFDKLTAEDVQTALDRFDVVVPHAAIVRKIIGIFPIKSYLEVVSPKIMDTECGCDTYTPVPPPQTEPNDDQYGFTNAMLVKDYFGVGTTVQNTLDQTPVDGYLIGIDSFDTGNMTGANNDRFARLAVVFQATEPVDLLALEFDWGYQGDLATVGGQVVYFGGQFWRSNGLNANWFKWGEWSGYQSIHAGNQGPWPGNGGFIKVYTEGWIPPAEDDLLYLGITLTLNLQNMGNASGIGKIRNLRFKARAANGGNYRATLRPVEFVPKTL